MPADPDARLAAALLVQAQALEGMRRAHSDLLGRVDQGAAQAAFARVAEEVRGVAQEVRTGHERLEREAQRGRRRVLRSTAVLAALLLVALGAVAWLVAIELPRARTAVETRLRAEFERLAEAGRARDEQALAALQAANDGQASRLDELAARVERADELAARLATATRERDDERAARLSAEQLGEGALAAQDDLARRLADREAELKQAKGERLDQIGENARLRDELIAKERRLEELGSLIASLNEDVERRLADATRGPGGIVTTHGNGGASLPSRATSALIDSGVSDVRVLETSGARDGSLRDLLVAWLDERGAPARVLRADEGRLVAEDGRSLLRLELAGGGREDLVLPELASDAWAACGVAPPDAFVPLQHVRAALDALLAGSGWEIESLGRFSEGQLGSLVLSQKDGREVVTGRLRAARAEVLPTGPELRLMDGTIENGSDLRPFFDGVFRLPLDGADYGAWLASTTVAAATP